LQTQLFNDKVKARVIHNHLDTKICLAAILFNAQLDFGQIQ